MAEPVGSKDRTVISLLSPDAAKPAPASRIVIHDSPDNNQGSVMVNSTHLQAALGTTAIAGAIWL